MPCSWEGNHRSGVALAMRQTLVALHLWAQGQDEGDEHPTPMLSCGAWLTLPYPCTINHDTKHTTSAGTWTETRAGNCPGMACTTALSFTPVGQVCIAYHHSAEINSYKTLKPQTMAKLQKCIHKKMELLSTTTCSCAGFTACSWFRNICSYLHQKQQICSNVQQWNTTLQVVVVVVVAAAVAIAVDMFILSR